MTTTKPLNVDIAGPADEEELVRLMHAVFAEQPIFPIEEPKMRDMVRSCLPSCAANALEEKKRGVIGVIRGKKGLEGYIIMTLSQYWYTEAWHLEELSNFVHPDHRHPGHAKSLIEFAKWFAEQLDMPLVMGILSTKRLEAKIRLYQRQVTPCGAIFVHNTGYPNNALSEMG